MLGLSIATTAKYTFSASETSVGCEPVDARLVLYPPDALDPSVWMASEALHRAGECLVLERRLTAGEYKICAAPIDHSKPLALNLVTSTAPATPSNDTCAGATLITGPYGFLPDVDLASANHNYSPMPIGACVQAGASKGPDRVWAIDLGTGDQLTVNVQAVSEAEGDASVYLLSDCVEWWTSCVAASADWKDPGVIDGLERIVYVNTGPPRRFYIVVDTPWQETPVVDLEWVVQ